MIRQLEGERGLEERKIDIIPVIETSKGIAALREICNAGTRIRRLSFGAWDFTLGMNMTYTRKAGIILESAVIDAMETFGFSADRYSDKDSDFDIVFESAQNRCLGEVEGKDNKPIDIHKFQQLERHISEDFARPEITEPAKGVLFGNPFRLIEPDNRKHPPFTDKVRQAAKRTGTALVHTPEMFPLVKYLKCIRDSSFSEKIRNAIVETEGEIVKFPDVPDFE